jgi:hypothetical protein
MERGGPLMITVDQVDRLLYEPERNILNQKQGCVWGEIVARGAGGAGGKTLLTE